MCFYNDDVADVHSVEFPVARKRHHCDGWCGVEIEKGERYMKSGSLFDGMWHHAKICLACRFDDWRIYQWERKDGCGHNESLCPYDEIGDALRARNMERTPKGAVPAYFNIKIRFHAVWVSMQPEGATS